MKFPGPHHLLAATFQGVLNLIPHPIQTPAGNIPNDGLGILCSLLLPTSAYAQMLARADAERNKADAGDDADD